MFAPTQQFLVSVNFNSLKTSVNEMSSSTCPFHQCARLPEAIALKFRGSLISRISRIWTDSQNYFNENFYTSAMHAHRHIPVHVHVLSLLSRTWMGSIRCSSCQSALQTSALVRDFCSKQQKRCTSAICLREGQESIPENEREEGRSWKASSRAWSASHHSLLKLPLNLCA